MCIGSKRSDNIRKARVQGVAHARKKRRLKGFEERRGRVKGEGTQSQVLAIGRSRGRQAQPPTTAVVKEVIICKILGCCGNTNRHCRNAPCNSNIGAMMQRREHCSNTLQYCSNTSHNNFSRALQAASALWEYCSNTSIDTGIAAMR